MQTLVCRRAPIRPGTGSAHRPNRLASIGLSFRNDYGTPHAGRHVHGRHARDGSLPPRVRRFPSPLLAEIGRDRLREQIRRAEAVHTADRHAGVAGVWLPEALDRKYPNAGRDLAWFWVFPSHTLTTDPRAGVVQRHHISDSVIPKAVKAATAAARIHKPVSVHTLRHSFATHLMLNGVDIRQIQEYLDHAQVETTMIYTHVVKELRMPARSPLDLLARQS